MKPGPAKTSCRVGRELPRWAGGSHTARTDFRAAHRAIGFGEVDLRQPRGREQGTATRALLDVDQLRALIKAGFAHPEHGWTDETERQWTIGTELCAAMARVYRAHGVSAIIDVYAPPWPGDRWATLMDELGGTVVTLLPSVEVCLARNAARGREPFMVDAFLRANYDGFAECVALHPPEHVIDSGVLTADEVA